MKPRRFFRFSGLTCLLVAPWLLVACSQAPDEVQVRAAISAAASAAESADAGDFGNRLSKNFDGNGGQVDKRSLVGLLRLQRLRGEHVSVLLGPVSIERRGERFVATFTVTLGGGGRLLPDRIGVYRVTSAWRKEDGVWHCYTATWKHLLS